MLARLLALVLLACVLVVPGARPASAQTASLLPNGQQQFSDANGAPYAGGSVYFYIPNTTTFKTTWVDPNQSVQNANPVVLDSAGRAIIYGNGQYRQVLRDASGALIWDQLTNGPVNTGVVNTGATGQLAYYASGGNTVSGLATPITQAQGGTGQASLAAAAIVTIGTPVGTTLLDSIFQGYISGLRLSAASSTTVGVAPGVAESDDATTLMVLGTAYTKTLSPWTVGSGVGCLDSGLVANGSWYAIFEIERTDSQVVDVVCTLATAGTPPSPVMPGAYTKKKYLGEIATCNAAMCAGGASTNVVPFVQLGTNFLLQAFALTSDTIGLTPALETLNVPQGVKVVANGMSQITNASASVGVLLNSPDMASIAGGALTSNVSGVTQVAGEVFNFSFSIRTDLNGRIRAVTSTNPTTLSLQVLGWDDPNIRP